MLGLQRMAQSIDHFTICEQTPAMPGISFIFVSALRGKLACTACDMRMVCDAQEARVAPAAGKPTHSGLEGFWCHARNQALVLFDRLAFAVWCQRFRHCLNQICYGFYCREWAKCQIFAAQAF